MQPNLPTRQHLIQLAYDGSPIMLYLASCLSDYDRPRKIKVWALDTETAIEIAEEWFGYGDIFVEAVRTGG